MSEAKKQSRRDLKHVRLPRFARKFEIATSLCSSQRQFYLNKGRRIATLPLVARNDNGTTFNALLLGSNF